MRTFYTLFVLTLYSIALAVEIEKTHPFVKSVQLYAAEKEEESENNKKVLNVPLMYIHGSDHIFLEFDWLGEDPIYQCYYKVYHCTKDWQRTEILESDYLEEINDFFSNEVSLSQTIAKQYVHCKAELPKPILSGNYIVSVYSEDEDKPLILRKFAIFENRVSIEINHGLANLSDKKQAFDFSVKFDDRFPYDFQDFTNIYVRKNYRWGGVKKITNPSMVDLGEKKISFRSNFSGSSFEGGNEYLSFDASSYQSLGVNTQKLERKGDTICYYLYPFKPFPPVYIKHFDINGQYLINNNLLDEPNTSSEYIKANFTLDYNRPLKGKAYVFGAFNNWSLTEENRLVFDSMKKRHEASIWLKQGYYNVKYVFQDESGRIQENYFSGSFHQTENRYEIFVYYYDRQLQADRIIGYAKYKFP